MMISRCCDNCGMRLEKVGWKASYAICDKCIDHALDWLQSKPSWKVQWDGFIAHLKAQTVWGRLSRKWDREARKLSKDRRDAR